MYSNLKIAWIVLLFMAGGVVIYLAASRITSRYLRKEITIKTLFHGFHQKIWMTAGLGIIFFGIYSFGIYASSIFISRENLRRLLAAIYRHPVASIYIGLFLFALTSAAIYVARMWIKYIYNNRY